MHIYIHSSFTFTKSWAGPTELCTLSFLLPRDVRTVSTYIHMLCTIFLVGSGDRLSNTAGRGRRGVAGNFSWRHVWQHYYVRYLARLALALFYIDAPHSHTSADPNTALFFSPLLPKKKEREWLRLSCTKGMCSRSSMTQTESCITLKF